MRAVAKVNVSRACLILLNERARARARKGVTCFVVFGQVRFSLDNDAGAAAPNDFRADELTCADDRIATEKLCSNNSILHDDSEFALQETPGAL